MLARTKQDGGKNEHPRGRATAAPSSIPNTLNLPFPLHIQPDRHCWWLRSPSGDETHLEQRHHVVADTVVYAVHGQVVHHGEEEVGRHGQCITILDQDAETHIPAVHGLQAPAM